MVLKDGRPDVCRNRICNNGEVGIFIRDKSKGSYTKNVVGWNNIDLIIEKSCEDTKTVHLDNDINGEIRTPYTYNCNIM